MKTKRTGLALLMLAALAAVGCAGQKTETAQNPQSENQTEQKQNSKNQNKNQTTDDTEENVDDDIELENLQEAQDSTIDLSTLKTGVKIASGGTYTLKGSGTQTVVVDAKDENVTLKLDGAEIQASALPAIFVRNAAAITIETAADSTLSSSRHDGQNALNAALYSRAPLTLSGNGKLTVADDQGHGIKGKDDITLENPNLAVTAAKDGIHASDSLYARNGTLEITSDDEGIQANEKLVFTDGTYTVTSAGDGLSAESLLQIDGGTYAIKTQNEGLESKDTLLISDGTISIQAQDDGINAANSLTISGGTVNIVSSANDGIDSNGDLNLTGGKISAVGLSGAEGAFDTDNTPFVISGGTIVGVSSTASFPSQTDQNTIMIQTSTSFSSVELIQNGKTLISWKALDGTTINNAVLTLSCADLVAGSEATVKLDGQEVETLTVEEGLTQVGNIRAMGGMGGMNGERGGRMSGEMDSGQTPPELPEGEMGEMPDGQTPPELPEGESGQIPSGQRPGRRNRTDQNTQSEPSSKGKTDTDTSATEQA